MAPGKIRTRGHFRCRTSGGWGVGECPACPEGSPPWLFGNVVKCTHRLHTCVNVPVSDEFVVETLFDDSLVVAAGSENPWTRRRRIDLAELVNEPWTRSWKSNLFCGGVCHLHESFGCLLPTTVGSLSYPSANALSPSLRKPPFAA
jgi:hypothetical protein